MMYDVSNVLVALFASGIIMAIGIGMYLVNAFTYYKMAQKANVNNAWLAFIPFLQFILFFHMIDRSAWYFLAFLVPILNLVLYFYWTYKLFEVFDQGGAIGVLVLVLSMFFGIAVAAYLLYIAFSDNVKYVSSNRYGLS
ncbi:hypothetical protein JR334_06480 [Clostridia bacterium]|nr:hypothetical protein JR334_06480 [Clostridia bacterium]